MNKDPSIATKWKGRVLIGIEHEDTENPKIDVEAMSTLPPLDAEGQPIEGAKSIVEEAQAYAKLYKYKLMWEFNSCINIPKKEGKFNMQLAVAEKTWTTEGGDRARAIGYNYNRWN